MFLCTTLSSCSWVSSFYIINDTNKPITIIYKLKSTLKDDDNYALKDTIEFFKLIKSEVDIIDIKESCNTPIKDEFIKEIEANVESYSVTIKPKNFISSGQNLYENFNFSNHLKRHEIFNNLIEMIIIRNDTKDTLIINKSMIADFSRPFGRHDIALIFD
jgi:hypothetical protein